MKVLICVVAGDKKKDTFPTVLESIFKMIDHTNHECNIFVSHEIKDSFVSRICDENEISHKACPVMSCNTFNKTLRTTSFSVDGYDEHSLKVIGELRNVCIDEAILHNYDYIFFIDADNTVDIYALDKLIDSGKNDISGWYYLKNVPSASCLKSPPKGTKLLKVNYTPGGCRLIHRDIFKNIRFEFKHATGEDMGFSEDVNVNGFGVFIHPLVYSDHIGGGYTDEARTYREAQLNK